MGGVTNQELDAAVAEIVPSLKGFPESLSSALDKPDVFLCTYVLGFNLRFEGKWGFQALRLYLLALLLTSNQISSDCTAALKP